jgi:hypothetical protein
MKRKQVNMQVNPQSAHMLKQQYLLCGFRLHATHVAELLEKLPQAKGESLLTTLDCYCFACEVIRLKLFATVNA